jgi:hypothetical protein
MGAAGTPVRLAGCCAGEPSTPTTSGAMNAVGRTRTMNGPVTRRLLATALLGAFALGGAACTGETTRTAGSATEGSDRERIDSNVAAAIDDLYAGTPVPGTRRRRRGHAGLPERHHGRVRHRRQLRHRRHARERPDHGLLQPDRRQLRLPGRRADLLAGLLLQHPGRARHLPARPRASRPASAPPPSPPTSAPTAASPPRPCRSRWWSSPGASRA